MKKTFLFFLVFFFPMCFSNTLKERLQKAKCGDYFVIKQKKISTIIRLAEIQKNKVIIEEISAPICVIENLDWQKWINNNAPGHTSWVLFEIDIDKNEIIEIFSFTRMAWLESEKKDNFFVKLLKSSLDYVPENARKKVGPPPLHDEIDRRAIWNPPMIIYNKKVKIPKYDVFQFDWPKDASELSEKTIQLYFDKGKEFFFPFWVELIGEHLSFSVKVIDAGHNLSSPKKNVPYRPIEFFLKPKASKKGLSFYLICPKYYKQFQVFALNSLDDRKIFKEIPHKIKKIQNEKIEIFIDSKTLKENLDDKIYYTWFIKPVNSKTVLEWKNSLINDFQ